MGEQQAVENASEADSGDGGSFGCEWPVRKANSDVNNVIAKRVACDPFLSSLPTKLNAKLTFLNTCLCMFPPSVFHTLLIPLGEFLVDRQSL